MSITTKTGDQGQTSLYTGDRVWKDDLRVEAYGTLDELDAHLGDARHLLQNAEIDGILDQVQNTLYRAMGQLATPRGDFPKPLTAEDVEEVTALIARFEERTPLEGFVVPGRLPASARLDICRTIARRAERQIVRLSRQEKVAEDLLRYVNRLSDLMYILARNLEAAQGAIRYKH